jgi:hypothetical protein
VSNSWLLSLSPGPEESEVDGSTLQHKLSLGTISSEKVATSSSQEQRKYSWRAAEPKSIPSLQRDVYIEPHCPETESHAGRNQGIEACPTATMMPGNLMQEPATYIVEAASHVGRAQLHEAQGDYDAAFAFYKTGIACLLGGVQGMTL